MKQWFLLVVFCCCPAVLKAAEDQLAPIVVYGTRIEESLRTTNRPVSIISAEDIALFPAKSLPELLGQATGVWGFQYGNIKNSYVDMRGSGEANATNVLVLVDGRRTNQIDLSGHDWSQVDVSTIERIEIIRGSGTVLYGDNANSGIINIITKRGVKNTKPSVTLSTEYGNYQTRKHGLELAGGFNKLDYQFNYSHESTTGFRANSNYWGNDYNTRLNYQASDDLSIELGQGYHLDRYQLPGALFPANIRDFGRTGVRSTLNNDRGVTSDIHFDVTPRLKLDAGASDVELSLFTTARKRSNNFYTGSSVYESVYTTPSYEFQPKVIVTTPLTDRITNKLTGGYDYFFAKSGRRSGTLGSAQDLVYVRKATHGVYLLDEIVLDERWIFNAGVRGGWADYLFDQRSVVKAKKHRSSTTQGYEAGVGYMYNKDSKIYVDMARSYRLPATDEFFQNFYDFGFGLGGGLNTALTHQVGNHYEVGIKDNTVKDLHLGANVYTAHYKDEIYLDPNTFLNTNYNGRTRHYGLETEAKLDLLNDRLSLFANWTLQAAVYHTGRYSGGNIPFVPDHLVNAGFNVRPLEGLVMGITMNHTGKSYPISDYGNAQAKLNAYTTFDWNASYSFKNVEVFFSVRNIFDRLYDAYGAYSVFAGDVGFYPAPGRNYAAGVKARF